MYNNAMKTIPDFPDYAVTEDGHVFSWAKPSGHGRPYVEPHELHGTLKNGYRVVVLRKAHQSHPWFVHRLVLVTFIGPSLGREARHLNGNKLDNRLDNLAWGTRVENAADRELHGHTHHPRGERHGLHRLSNQDVLAIRRLGSLGIPQVAIGRHFGIHQGTVSKLLNRRRWPHI